MAQMIVRNIDEDLMAAFKELARQRGTSTEQQARELIRREVETASRWTEFRRLSKRMLESWRAEGITFDDSTPLIREDRER
jgi:plasmid stability protein